MPEDHLKKTDINKAVLSRFVVTKAANTFKGLSEDLGFPDSNHGAIFNNFRDSDLKRLAWSVSLNRQKLPGTDPIFQRNDVDFIPEAEVEAYIRNFLSLREDITDLIDNLLSTPEVSEQRISILAELNAAYRAVFFDDPEYGSRKTVAVDGKKIERADTWPDPIPVNENAPNFNDEVDALYARVHAEERGALLGTLTPNEPAPAKETAPEESAASTSIVPPPIPRYLKNENYETNERVLANMDAFLVHSIEEATASAFEAARRETMVLYIEKDPRGVDGKGRALLERVERDVVSTQTSENLQNLAEIETEFYAVAELVNQCIRERPNDIEFTDDATRKHAEYGKLSTEIKTRAGLLETKILESIKDKKLGTVAAGHLVSTLRRVRRMRKEGPPCATKSGVHDKDGTLDALPFPKSVKDGTYLTLPEEDQQRIVRENNSFATAYIDHAQGISISAHKRALEVEGVHQNIDQDLPPYGVVTGELPAPDADGNLPRPGKGQTLPERLAEQERENTKIIANIEPKVAIGYKDLATLIVESAVERLESVFEVSNHRIEAKRLDESKSDEKLAAISPSDMEASATEQSAELGKFVTAATDLAIEARQLIAVRPHNIILTNEPNDSNRSFLTRFRDLEAKKNEIREQVQPAVNKGIMLPEEAASFRALILKILEATECGLKNRYQDEEIRASNSTRKPAKGPRGLKDGSFADRPENEQKELADNYLTRLMDTWIKSLDVIKDIETKKGKYDQVTATAKQEASNTGKPQTIVKDDDGLLSVVPDGDAIGEEFEIVTTIAPGSGTAVSASSGETTVVNSTIIAPESASTVPASTASGVATNQLPHSPSIVATGQKRGVANQDGAIVVSQPESDSRQAGEPKGTQTGWVESTNTDGATPKGKDSILSQSRPTESNATSRVRRSTDSGSKIEDIVNNGERYPEEHVIRDRDFEGSSGTPGRGPNSNSGGGDWPTR